MPLEKQFRKSVECDTIRHKKRNQIKSDSFFSTPAGVRTLDTLIKSQVLYQLSYGCNFSNADAKVHTFI